MMSAKAIRRTESQGGRRRPGRETKVFPKTLYFAALPCLFLIGGCLSIMTQAHFLEDGIEYAETPVMVYSGVQGDVAFIVEGSFTHPGPCRPPAIIGVLDFPFSLCVDTALLPVTLPEPIGVAVSKGCASREAGE